MRLPKCEVVTGSEEFKNIFLVTRSIRYDGQDLMVDIQGESLIWIRITFRDPIGFRVLDERDLCEFWDSYSTRSGWLYEVFEGGWRELEMTRERLVSHSMVPDLKEFLLVDDKCINVLCADSPTIESLGADRANSARIQ